MKTAGRENPNRWATVSSNRAPGAGVQNRSCSIQWAAKQENVQPLQVCFFLTSPFIELIGQVTVNREFLRRSNLRISLSPGWHPHGCRATQAPLEQEWDEALGAAHVLLIGLAQGRNQRGFLNGYAVCIGDSHAGKNCEKSLPNFRAPDPVRLDVMRAPV